MAKNRVFNDEELKEMGVQTKELAIRAVRAGDLAGAEKLINRMQSEVEALHESTINWVADLLDYIYARDGGDGVEKALRKSYERTESKRIELYKKLDFRAQVQNRAAALRMQLQKLEIIEDDEKVSIKMVPCGNGQRLLETGTYDPPRNARIKPHRITWGLDNFPTYCCHAPMQELISIEKLGYPIFARSFPKKFGSEGCWFHMYKNPKDVPEEFYTRVGQKKPK